MYNARQNLTLRIIQKIKSDQPLRPLPLILNLNLNKNYHYILGFFKVNYKIIETENLQVSLQCLDDIVPVVVFLDDVI